jgi:alkylation response protein AidB-like acyl-CoA dehydrogenase
VSRERWSEPSGVDVELRETVRSMLAEQSPPARVLARCEDGEPFDPKLWRILAVEMGLAGLAIPEQYGGGGAGWPVVAVVVEELGRSVAPVPYLGSAVVATTALLAVGDAELLASLAGGAVIAALAVPFATPPGPADPAVRVERDLLSGEVAGVADALAADVLLVPTAAGLYEVPASADGVQRRPVVSLDLTRPVCDLVLDRAPGRLLAAGPAGARAVDAALLAGAALLAAEQLGLGQWCLESTVEYVKSRYQFGRPVGSFQAVKHRLADVWVALTQARAVAEHAAACVGTGEAPVGVALAQAFCGPAAVQAAQECVQLHGGIGFTWEHPAHLYLKRAKSAAIAFGTADRHRLALGALVNLPPPGTAPRSR